MNYAELCQSIGIDREAIAKACAEPRNHALSQEPERLSRAIGPRIKPPVEDLSHCVSVKGQKVANKLRKRSYV